MEPVPRVSLFWHGYHYLIWHFCSLFEWCYQVTIALPKWSLLSKFVILKWSLKHLSKATHYDRLSGCCDRLVRSPWYCAQEQKLSTGHYCCSHYYVNNTIETKKFYESFWYVAELTKVCQLDCIKFIKLWKHKLWQSL